MTESGTHTIKEINNVLLRQESDFDLLDRQANSVYYWERVRHDFHKRVIRQIEKKDVNPTEIGGIARIQRNISDLAAALENVFIKNPFLAGQSEIVFYGKGRRRQLSDGIWYDLHLDPIAETVDSRYTFIEPYRGPSRAASENRRYLTLPVRAADVARKLGYSYDLPDEEVDVLRRFQSTITAELGVEVDVIPEIERQLANRRIRLPLFTRVIRRIDPDICFMTYGHSHHSTFIEACHEHDVPVVDVQYCALDRNYWPYHYPGERQRRVKPDYLFLWGEYWKDAVELPFSDDDIYVTGFPYYERQVTAYEDTPEKDQILFVSNGKSGPSLSKVAAELSGMDLGMDVVYKLHGEEFDTWRDDYPQLAEVADAGRVVVLDEVEGNLHRLLAESKVQVGVSTTAIYEGLGFGLPTFILDVPRAYEMEGLTENGHAELVSGAEELTSALSSIEGTAPPDVELFFEPSSSGMIRSSIEEITG